MSDIKGMKDFDILYSQLIDLSKSFPEFQFKTVTALLLIVGWLVTSVSAKEFINDNASIALPATLFAFGLLVVFKIIWIVGHYRKIETLQDRLANIAAEVGVSSDSVSTLKLGKVLPVTYVAVNILLSSAVVVVVWLICRPITNT